MKILITGVTGFIGKAFLSQVAAADEIIAVCLSPSEELPGHVRVIESDLSYPEKLFKELKAVRPDVCVHLAWSGIPDYGFKMSLQNVDQSAVLLRYLVEECGCRKILAAGSCWEYGRAFGPCQENKPSAANSYFAWAKHALSELGMMLAAKNAISFIWTRLFYVYGPGQRAGSLIPTMAEALKNGKCPAVKSPHNANDFVFIDDVAEALGLALSKDVPTGIYNLGAGKAIPVWKVCEIMEKAMGRDSSYSIKMKQSLVQAEADFWADTSKTDTILGWRAKTDIETGIKQYLKALESEG